MLYIYNVKQQQIKQTIMTNLSKETKVQAAVQMTIMDAMENGHTNAAELVEYMKSEVFESAVARYIEMMNN